MLELWGSNPQEAVKLLLEVGDNKGAVSIWDSPFLFSISQLVLSL
jgi:hypothetical protein